MLIYRYRYHAVAVLAAAWNTLVNGLSVVCMRLHSMNKTRLLLLPTHQSIYRVITRYIRTICKSSSSGSEKLLVKTKSDTLRVVSTVNKTTVRITMPLSSDSTSRTRCSGRNLTAIYYLGHPFWKKSGLLDTRQSVM